MHTKVAAGLLSPLLVALWGCCSHSLLPLIKFPPPCFDSLRASWMLLQKEAVGSRVAIIRLFIRRAGGGGASLNHRRNLSREPPGECRNNPSMALFLWRFLCKKQAGHGIARGGGRLLRRQSGPQSSGALCPPYRSLAQATDPSQFALRKRRQSKLLGLLQSN